MSAANKEFEKRLKAVRASAESNGFEAILTGDDNSWFIPGGHGRYLSNFSSARVGYVDMVLIPVKSDPMLIVPIGPMNSNFLRAKQKSWIADVKGTPLPKWPPPPSNPKDLEDALRDRNLTKARIGYCGRIPSLGEMQKKFPESQFVKAARTDARGIERDFIEEIRAVKSAYEEDIIRRVQLCSDIGVQAFMNAIAPAAKQDVARIEGEYAAKKKGAEEVLIFMASGNKPWMWGCSAKEELTFREGDMVACEFNTRIDGYVAQIARSRVVGRPKPDQQQLLDVAIEAEEKMIKSVRLGITGGELWDEASKVVKEAGFEMWGRYGHGMGMSMAETLDIMAGDDGRVNNQQCLEIHAGVRSPKSGEAVLIGDQVMVKDGAAEVLSSVPKDLGQR